MRSETPCAKREYIITQSDLPLSCPPGIYVYGMHIHVSTYPSKRQAVLRVHIVELSIFYKMGLNKSRIVT